MRFRDLVWCLVLSMFLYTENTWAEVNMRSKGEIIAEALRQEENVPENIASDVAIVIDQNNKDSVESRVKKGLVVLKKYGLVTDKSQEEKFSNMIREILNLQKTKSE